jgi:formylglycine-generating enzyme required for sulfatase activity
VTVQDFYIGKYEVTQAQWKAVMGADNNPSSFKGDDLPVERVTWNDAKAFCEKLNRMTSRTYRLPSEAEWEYACRARTTGAYAGNLDAMAWYADNADYKTHPVGQKQANAFGLYDMHGNVWEWCEDIYHTSYDGKHGNPPADGSAWLSGGVSNFRALRGGAWGNESRIVRSATRSGSPIGEQYFKFGFRVAASTRTP